MAKHRWGFSLVFLFLFCPQISASELWLKVQSWPSLSGKESQAAAKLSHPALVVFYKENCQACVHQMGQLSCPALKEVSLTVVGVGAQRMPLLAIARRIERTDVRRLWVTEAQLKAEGLSLSGTPETWIFQGQNVRKWRGLWSCQELSL